jgi:hypothetical protein
MAAIQADEIGIRQAIDATTYLYIRDLPEHVPVGPLPVGAVNPGNLPFNEMDPNANQTYSHFFDVVCDIDPMNLTVDNIKAVIRDKAWHELPEQFTLRERPLFTYVVQYFLVPQSANDKLCLVKHYYLKSTKVKGSYISSLVRGTAYAVSWGATPSASGRKALQWMLEQLGGLQWRHFSLSSEKK